MKLFFLRNLVMKINTLEGSKEMSQIIGSELDGEDRAQLQQCREDLHAIICKLLDTVIENLQKLEESPNYLAALTCLAALDSVERFKDDDELFDRANKGDLIKSKDHYTEVIRSTRWAENHLDSDLVRSFLNEALEYFKIFWELNSKAMFHSGVIAATGHLRTANSYLEVYDDDRGVHDKYRDIHDDDRDIRDLYHYSFGRDVDIDSLEESERNCVTALKRLNEFLLSTECLDWAQRCVEWGVYDPEEPLTKHTVQKFFRMQPDIIAILQGLTSINLVTQIEFVSILVDTDYRNRFPAERQNYNDTGFCYIKKEHAAQLRYAKQGDAAFLKYINQEALVFNEIIDKDDWLVFPDVVRVLRDDPKGNQVVRDNPKGVSDINAREIEKVPLFLKWAIPSTIVVGYIIAII